MYPGATSTEGKAGSDDGGSGDLEIARSNTAVDLERKLRQREGEVTMERTLGACGLPRH